MSANAKRLQVAIKPEVFDGDVILLPRIGARLSLNGTTGQMLTALVDTGAS